jgi:hypothetical protein
MYVFSHQPKQTHFILFELFILLHVCLFLRQRGFSWRASLSTKFDWVLASDSTKNFATVTRFLNQFLISECSPKHCECGFKQIIIDSLTIKHVFLGEIGRAFFLQLIFFSCFWSFHQFCSDFLLRFGRLFCEVTRTWTSYSIEKKSLRIM